MTILDEETRFRKEVADSVIAAQAVSRWLESSGRFSTTVIQPKMRPSFDQRDGYGDDYDLVAVPKPIRIEIKWRRLNFTCHDDYEYETIIIDRVDKVDEKKPDQYAIVNRSLTHAAIISSRTKSGWLIAERVDRRKGYPFRAYEAPKHLASFVSLTKVAI